MYPVYEFWHCLVKDLSIQIQNTHLELDLTIQVLEILHCLVWHNIICPSSLNAIFKIVLGEGGTDKLLLYKIPYELNNEVI